MSQKIQSVKGMNDLLPVEQKDFKLTADFWQAFENQVQKWTQRFGYKQIRTPIVEHTNLFVRSIGEETDVVGKEMYTFNDNAGETSLSLRPEGTASCLRAVVEHDLTYAAPQKLWYMGAMFRAERPQKGRYRQFHQVGIEALGFADPDIDAEIIAMCADLWRELGISGQLTLEINSLGNREERAAHRAALVAYLSQHEAELDDDSKRRLHTNPLRVLDSKNPALQDICNAAPRLLDYLGEASLQHYNTFKALLDGLQIKYIENPRLVRGLDYYNHTVFEWTTDKLGAQATVCGGGRYSLKADFAPDVFVMQQGEGATLAAMKHAQTLRGAGLNVAQFSGSTKLKNQFKRADQSGAAFAVIIAENEVTQNTVTIKDLRGGRGQTTVAADELVQQLNEWSTQ